MPELPATATTTELPQQEVASTMVPAPPGTVVVANKGDQSLTLIDATTNEVRKTVATGIPPSKVSVAPDRHTTWLFGSQPGASDVYFLDLGSGASQGNSRLGQDPYAAAFSPDGRRSFVVMRGSSSVSFLDANNRNSLGQVYLGEQPEGVLIRRQPSDIAFVPDGQDGLLYVAGYGSGVIWELDAATGRQLTEIETGGSPMILLADPATPLLFAIVDTLNQVLVIDTSRQQIAGRFDLPGRPAAAAVSPDGIIFVAAAEAGEVWAIRASTGSVLSNIQVGARPDAVAFSPDGSRAYVANGADGTLSVIDVPALHVIATLQVGKEPVSVAFVPPVEEATPAETPASGGSARQPQTLSTIAPQATPVVQDRLPADTVKETFVPGANLPSAMAFAPDGRLFYGELRTGEIRVVEKGVLLADPFYDFTVAGEAETGLLGLTLDPSFTDNHYIYIFYTEAGGAEPRDGSINGPNQVVRLTDVDGKGADLTPIVSNLPSGPFHDAGNLRFGPDGRLYITVGETGNMSLSQDLSSLAGKILRVNPDGSTPSDNPFAGQPDKAGAIWAYGFRNPFDLDFHPVTGVLITGDNGPGDNDELDVVAKGGNYGWPPAGFQDRHGVTEPISVINPPVAPAGVSFYNGSQIPDWQNDLFYCTFHRGQLRRVHLVPRTTDRTVLEEIVTSGCTLRVTAGPDGALYFSDVNAIYRVRSTGSPALPAVELGEPAAASPAPVLPPGTRAEDSDVNVTMTEWKLILSRTTVPAGRIRFLVENLGATTHALRITGNGVDESTGDMAHDTSHQVEVDLQPGTYRLFCPIGNHADLGMDTNITVLGP